MRDKRGIYNELEELGFESQTPENNLWAMVVVRFLRDLFHYTDETISEYILNRGYINEIIINKANFSEKQSNRIIEFVEEIVQNKSLAKKHKQDFRALRVDKIEANKSKVKTTYKKIYSDELLKQLHNKAVLAINFFNSDANEDLIIKSCYAMFGLKQSHIQAIVRAVKVGLLPPLPEKNNKKKGRMLYLNKRKVLKEWGRG